MILMTTVTQNHTKMAFTENVSGGILDCLPEYYPTWCLCAISISQ